MSRILKETFFYFTVCRIKYLRIAYFPCFIYEALKENGKLVSRNQSRLLHSLSPQEKTEERGKQSSDGSWRMEKDEIIFIAFRSTSSINNSTLNGTTNNII